MKALVGFSGFVGSNIANKYDFDCVYNSKNIDEAYDTYPDLLVYAGLRAEKFIANNNPEKDMQSIKYWIRPFDGTVSPGLFFYKTGGMRHRYQLLMNTAEIFAKLYAHSAVYADLSPENVFASGSLESSEVWLIDADNMRYKFDVKKQIQTPGYGAPEIIKGEMNSIQADEYSYAILAHEVLTMNSPFNGQLLIEGDGGGWDDEEVDYADLASKGEVAWIYDENDDSNRCKTGIGPKYAFTATIKTLFEKNFGEEGRHNPLSRPKMRDWYVAMRQAVDLTAKCQYCGSTFLFQNASCKVSSFVACFFGGKNVSVITADARNAENA